MPVEGGLVHFRIEIDGRESHAGNRYMSVHAGGLGDRAGVNAIEKMLSVVTALQDLERQWGNLRYHPMLPAGFNTIMPGLITGGPGGGAEGKLNLVSNPGTSPNYCSAEYNLWFLPGESFPAIRDEVESFVWAVSQTDPGCASILQGSHGNCAISISRPRRLRRSTRSSGALSPRSRKLDGNRASRRLPRLRS